MGWETGVQSQVESYQKLKKWYSIPPCLTFNILTYVSRVKWSNPREGVAPSSTPWCSSYWKGSFRVALDYGRQLCFYYTNRDWCFWHCHQRIIKGTEGLGNKRTSRDHPKYYIIENGQNTEKSTGDLRRLAVTQTPVRDHRLTLMWKTFKE